MNILVLGSDGQLGQTFRDLSHSVTPSHQFIFWTRKDLDLTRPDDFLKIKSPAIDLVINCAAYTAVDRAEEEQDLAYLVNGTNVGILGEHLGNLGVPIIHFSSDYVYHNDLERPLQEEDPCQPKGHYAKSKLLGEQELVASHPFPLIFRVSWLYGRFGHNFPKTMLRLGKERNSIKVVNDQFGAPTYADDVVQVIWHLLKSNADRSYWMDISGIYNFCNTGRTNWHQIAERVISNAGLSCDILAIPSIDYQTAAPRPSNSVLDLTKFVNKFEIPTLPWQQRIDVCINALINES